MIIRNSIIQLESGREYSVDYRASSVTLQTNGAAVSITGTVDGENWVDVAAVSMEDYSVSSTTGTSGIYRVMLAGGLSALKFTFASGTVSACAT